MSHSIMLVDDDDNLRSLMAVFFKNAGYTIHEARDGRHALRMLDSVTPDLFIVDVLMPEMNGYDLVKTLRADPRTAHHPIFFLSSKSDAASVKEGLEAGANRYLVKPMQTNIILVYIKQVLAEVMAE